MSNTLNQIRPELYEQLRAFAYFRNTQNILKSIKAKKIERAVLCGFLKFNFNNQAPINDSNAKLGCEQDCEENPEMKSHMAINFPSRSEYEMNLSNFAEFTPRETVTEVCCQEISSTFEENTPKVQSI